MINVNCKYNDKGAWCKNKNIKRSLFGIGTRVCKLYGEYFLSSCEYKEEYSKPPFGPPPHPISKNSCKCHFRGKFQDD